ncbi:MAG: PmbA protein [Parcubacteria group bacterium Gr01-1014_48]|nr:MAG: PmbA protein [Parcubacteria group bacterium Greene0416_14]TSC73478.1 MAG: PmbA protein [Parcubacteria group bacterium Gr01-1014_48]TSD00555.1 MAG: PmbA protein [Parcubacteria group bacterium Greene1014_15]TSD08248.1 MAG: PmbA protein [Parcubacteria group bacterium Greene0714_4]
MEICDIGKMLLSAAKKHGATGARVIAGEEHSYGVVLEQGNVRPEITHSRWFTFAVHVGLRTATVATTTSSLAGLDRLAQKGVEMARASSDDPYAFLSNESLWQKNIDGLRTYLDLYDRSPRPTLAELEDSARALEDAVLSQEGITRIEGAVSAAVYRHDILLTSAGFEFEGEATSYMHGAGAVAGDGEAMVEGSKIETTTHRTNLRTPEQIGLIAAKRALARRGACSVSGGRMPVVFDILSSPQIISALFSAISGENVYSENTFLKEFLGKRICNEPIQIADHPHLPRMNKSRICDEDGVASRYTPIVVDGVLKTWLTSLKSAAKLGVVCTGHGGGQTGNIIVDNGDLSRDELIEDIPRGLLVTHLLGRGVDLPTGDYSFGAAGFLIENGKVSRPVDEMTIAGNLLDLFRTMRVANDRDMREAVSVPSIRVEDVTVAGKS